MNSTSLSEVAAMMRALFDKLQDEQNLRFQEPGRELLIDVSVILRSDAKTGIQRVVRALLGALLDADLSGYVVRPVFATRKDGYAYVEWSAPLLSGRQIPIELQSGPVMAGPGDIFLGLDLAANILPHHQRQIARWRKRGCLIAAVMYDLLPEQRPDWFNPKTRRNYRRWLRVVARQSDRIICISQDVASQLGAWIGARPWRGNSRLRIQHMRLGCDISNSSPTNGLHVGAAHLLSELAKRRTLLVVGTIEPRKGHACLLPAFDLLLQDASCEDLSLVFVGRPGWRTEALQARMREHAEAQKRFFWFDDASDELLTHLYGLAHGVIVPSLAEGFGLPLVEARGHGVPVLARDLPVFRAMSLAEVTYFSQDDPASLAESIKTWLDQGASAAGGGNEAPTWRDSFTDLLSCLSIEEHDVPCKEAIVE